MLLRAPHSQGSPEATCLLTHFLSLGREGQRPAFLLFLAEHIYIIVQVVPELVHVLNCLLEEWASFSNVLIDSI